MLRNSGKLLITHINPSQSIQWAIFSCILSESQNSLVSDTTVMYPYN